MSIDDASDDASAPAGAEWFPDRVDHVDQGVWCSRTELSNSLMNTKPGEKYAFGPEGIENNPDAECTGDDCPDDVEFTDDPRCGCDARYKWTVPDNWSGFETARKWAENDPTLSDAVMVVLQREGEAYQPPADETMLFDGDNVVDENGNVHPEFVALVNRVTDGPGYAALSSSGHGIHVVLVGTLPDGHVQLDVSLSDDLDEFDYGHIDEDDDEDEVHVDIFDGKRLRKATGKRIEGTPKDAAEVDGDELAALFDEETDEGELSELADDDGGTEVPNATEVFGYDDGGGEFDGPELSEDHVRDALEHVDESLPYQKWISLGFAIHDWDASERGKRVFEEWSQSNPKWSSDGQPHIDDIWTNGTSAAERERSASVGTLVYLAREGGWEPPTMAERAKRTAFEAVADAADTIESIDDDAGLLERSEVTQTAIDTAVERLATARTQGFEDTDRLCKELSKRTEHTKGQIVEKVEQETADQVDDDVESSWAAARQEYAPKSANGGQDDLGRQYAADLILDSEHLRTHDGSEIVYRYDEHRGVYDPNGRHIIRQRCEDGLEHRSKKTREENIINKIQNRTFTDREEFGGPSGKVCVNNGVIDVPTQTRNDHSPEHLFLAAVNTDHDPDAECPTFDRVVEECIAERDRQKFIEYLGYCLMRWSNPYKKAMFCQGPQDSGKSTLLNVLVDLLGRENVASEPLKSIVDTKWGAAQLYGTYANIRHDIESEDLERPNRVKMYTGNDELVDAQKKNEQKFQFKPVQKHIYAANSYPAVTDADLAFHDRWLHVEFPNRVPPAEQDSLLSEKLKAEKPGILNRMLEALDRRRQQDRFTGERSREQKVSHWMGRTDKIGEFIDTYLVLTGDTTGDYERVGDVAALYESFCREEGYEKGSNPKQDLTQYLKSLPPKIIRKQKMVNGDRFYCYFGLQIDD